MMRWIFIVCFVILAGSLRAESPAAVLTDAAKLSEQGEFKKAAAELGGALDTPGLTLEQRRELTRQVDLLHRIKEDYSFTKTDLYERLAGAVTNLTSGEFDRWIAEGRFDSRKIDGEMMFVNTSVNNLFFRNPELRKRRMNHRDDLSEQKGRLADCRAITAAAREEKTPYVLPHHYTCTMTVSVHPEAVPAGAKIRAWLPIPRNYPYQRDFKFLGSSVPVVSMATGDSPIRCAYLEPTAARDGSCDIKITYSYTMYGVHFDLDPKKIQPADLSDPELRKYTSESPHVIFTDDIRKLADKIAGKETNPMLVAKKFYDWIGLNIQYSFAREYSTLTNISEYCLSHRYGDCGQEAMLFIALCRTHGIPARWQTGWDLYPDFNDIHDWSEIYLAPYGWVPVDAWAGLYATQYCTALKPGERRELHNFYFGGLDYYRMASNSDHSQKLEPPKETARSDDVDFQRGELECNGTNLYFDKYSYSMLVKEN